MNSRKTPDAGRWNEVVSLYYMNIVRYAAQFLGNLDEAYDAAQDTFLKAYRSNSPVISEDRGEELRFWLYRICRNVCIDRKRWWKRLLVFRGKIEKEPPWPAADAVTLTLKEAIAALPLKQREVFILRHWHGFSTDETSQLLGIGQGTVKSHLSRAIKRLKQELQEAGELGADNRSKR